MRKLILNVEDAHRSYFSGKHDHDKNYMLDLALNLVAPLAEGLVKAGTLRKVMDMDKIELIDYYENRLLALEKKNAETALKLELRFQTYEN